MNERELDNLVSADLEWWREQQEEPEQLELIEDLDQ